MGHAGVAGRNAKGAGLPPERDDREAGRGGQREIQHCGTEDPRDVGALVPPLQMDARGHQPLSRDPSAFGQSGSGSESEVGVEFKFEFEYPIRARPRARSQTGHLLGGRRRGANMDTDRDSAFDGGRRVVERAFPELDAVEDDDLRDGCIEAWTTAMADAGIEDLEGVPWFPPAQRRLGLDDEFLVDHVRDVTRLALSTTETLREHRDVECSLDTVLAGALVHDVSKLYEFDGMEETPVGDLLGHPHYGVHVVSRAGLPVELAHIVLSHTGRTTVEPATLEAEVVRRADEVAASAIRLRVVDDLRDA